MRQSLENPRKNLLSRTYSKVKKTVRLYYKAWILDDVFPLEVKRWFRDKGDETLRLDYDLNANSIVFDVGGYVGDFAESMYKKYNCTVYVFEPSKDFYEICINRFAGNPKVKCFNFGLSDVNGNFSLSERADGSSMKSERHSENANIVEVRRFFEVFHELGIVHVDLLKINIEGGEYDLLPHILNEGLINNIENVQVQFHNFITNAKPMRQSIIDRLKCTHQCDWSYVFVWENWSRLKVSAPN